MIKAKDARIISSSVKLDEHILDAINIAIIKEASKGKFFANITEIMAEISYKRAYFNYFEELGYYFSSLRDGYPGLYIEWYQKE